MALGPLPPPRPMSREVVDRLASEIRARRLRRGARLPSEQQMMAAFGVSRTVVREAVAALRADGLVVSRQGAGTFVAGDADRRPFRIAPQGLRSIDEVLDILELRMGVEVEAAGLAAERASPARLRRVREALGAIDRAIAAGEPAIDEDFTFHAAIAEAADNPYFGRFLGFLGRLIIPRQSIRVQRTPPAEQRSYLNRIQAEHRAIFLALRQGDAPAARSAMRRHLANGRERYRRLAAPARGD
jgi:GntR family transcriptional repressor for pyruvate dehydrogenase complex